MIRPSYDSSNFIKAKYEPRIKPKLRIRKMKRVTKDFRIVPETTKPLPSFFA